MGARNRGIPWTGALWREDRKCALFRLSLILLISSGCVFSACQEQSGPPRSNSIQTPQSARQAVPQDSAEQGQPKNEQSIAQKQRRGEEERLLAILKGFDERRKPNLTAEESVRQDAFVKMVEERIRTNPYDPEVIEFFSSVPEMERRLARDAELASKIRAGQLQNNPDDLHSVFARGVFEKNEASFSMLQQDDFWNSSLKGRWVSWTGRVREVRKAIFGDTIVVMVKSGARENVDIKLVFHPSWASRLLQIQIGTVITFSGQLDSFGGLDNDFELINAGLKQP